MIDIWLLATLFVPFMEVLLQISIQRMKRTLEGLEKSLEENDVSVDTTESSPEKEPLTRENQDTLRKRSTCFLDAFANKC